MGKEPDYFEMFVKGVGHALEAAKMLKALLDDGKVTQERVSAVKKIENDADTHMHILCERLNTAFITPIDRDDIYRIAKETDDITDSIERVANDLWVMHVDRITGDMRLMGQYVVDACEMLVQLMSEIKNHKRSNKLYEYTVEINRIEELGDKCYKNAIYALFEKERIRLRDQGPKHIQGAGGCAGRLRGRGGLRGEHHHHQDMIANGN
jgi:uncharacterized protein Yka (UPF0111/DUF47 family)